MANTVDIDKHVVQMVFDNAAFERKVSTTRTSLKNLKKDLDFSDTNESMSGLKNALSGIDLNKIQNNIESLSSRFSTFGIVGMTAIQKVTNSIMNFGSKVASSTIGQIFSGGKKRALNLEQAQFQISGLGVDWENADTELGKSLKQQINTAVSGTAYGLDAAAKVAGQLLASNIKEGTQDMQNALSGIAGVAAMTNRSYEEIGHIFTTIAGNGRIMGEQLNQFASRGLNVAAELAKVYEVDEKTLREMVSKGQVDFKTFAKAMNNAFGEQATKANETFTGALSNVNAALSRIGESIMAPYHENLRKFFVELIPVLDGVRDTLDPVYKVLSEGMSRLSRLSVDLLHKLAFKDEDGLHLVGLQKVKDFLTTISTLIREIGPDGENSLSHLGRSIWSVFDIFSSFGKLIKSVVQPIFDGFSKAASFQAHSIYNITKRLSNGLEALAKYISNLVSLIDKALNKNNALAKILGGVFSVLKGLASVLKILFAVVGKGVNAFIKLLGIILQILAPFGSFLTMAIDGILDLSNVVRRAFKPLTKSFAEFRDAIFIVIKPFKALIINIIKPFSDRIKSLGVVWNSTSSVIFNALSSFVKFAVDKIGLLTSFLLSHKESVEKAARAISNAFSNITSGIKTGWDRLKNVISSFKDNNNLFALISEKFVSFRDRMASVVSSFKNIRMDGIQTFKDNLVKSVTNSTGPLQAIGNFFVNLWETIKIVVAKVSPIIKQALSSIFDALGKVVENIKKGFAALNTDAGIRVITSGGIIAALAIFLQKLNKIFDTIFKMSKHSPLNEFVSIFKSFTDTVNNYVKQMAKTKAAEALKTFANALLEIAAAIFILSFIDPDKMFGALMVVSTLIYELVLAFKALNGGSVAASVASTTTASALLKLSTSLLVLAFAIKVFEKMDPKILIVSASIVSALLWELVGALKALSSSSEEKRVVKGASALIMMAFAIKILTSSIEKLSDIDYKPLLASSVALFAIIKALSNLAGTLAENNEGVFKASIALMIMALAIDKISKVVEELSTIDPTALAPATVAIVALIIAMKKFFEIKKEDAESISKSIRSIAISMLIVVAACKLFESVDDEAMKKAGIAFAAVIGSFAVMMIGMAALNRFTKDANKNAETFIGIGAAIIGLGIAVAALAKAAQLLADVDWSAVGKASVGLVAMIAALTALVFLSKIKMNPKNMIAMSEALVAVSIAMLFMGKAVSLLSDVPLLVIGAGLVAFVVVLQVLVNAARLLEGRVDVLFKLAKALALIGLSTVLFSIGIAAFALALPILATSIGLVGTIFAGLLALFVKLVPLIIKAVEAIVTAIVKGIMNAIPTIKNAIIDAATAALNVLNDLIPKIGDTLDILLETVFPLLREWLPKILKLLERLIPEIVETIVVIIIKVIEVIADRVPDLVGAIAKFFRNLIGAIKDVTGVELSPEKMATLLLGLGIFAVILVVVGYAAKLAQKSLAGMIALIIFVGLMAFMFTTLMSLDTGDFINVAEGIGFAFLAISAALFIISNVPIAGAIQGAIGLIVVVAVLTGVLYALGALAENVSGMKETIEAGIEIFGLLGTAIGEFVGNLIGALLGGMSTGLPTIAQSLSDFMDNLQPFIEGMREIDGSVLDGALNLSGVILAFTAASFIDGIASFFGGGLNLVKFGEQLVAFAPYMRTFAGNFAGVEVDNVKKAAEAAKALADFASAIPNSGGLLGKIVGEKDMDTFGSKLEALGEGLVAFNNIVQNIDESGEAKGIDVNLISNAADAGTAIARMAKEIPNSGGWLGKILGENDMGPWAIQLKTLATGIVDFNNIVKNNGEGIDKEAIEDAADAAQYIVDVAKDIPNEGGMLADLLGDNSLGQWAPELTTLGENLVKFSDAVKGKALDGAAISYAMLVVKDLVNIAKEIPNEKGFIAFFTGDNSLGEFSKHLEPLGKNLTKFSNSLKNVELNRVSYASKSLKSIAEIAVGLSGINKDNIKNFSESIEALGKANVEKFLSAFSNSKNDCDEAINSFAKTFTNSIDNKAQSFINNGKAIVERMSNGIIQNEKKLKEAFLSMTVDALNIFSGFNQTLFWIGRNFAVGIANGIYANEYAVINAAISVATAAINTTHNTLQEKSPSRVAFEAGKYWDIGLAGGMIKFSHTVSDASEQVSNEVLDYVGHLQSIIDDIDFDNMDPTIRPVMDMSNINNGVRAIDNLMQNSRTYSIGAFVSRDRSEYSKRDNTLKVKTDNTDVINALSELKTEVSGLRDKMSRMSVYLDGKAMVGELTDPLDKSLGRKASRNSGGVVSGRVVQR